LREADDECGALGSVRLLREFKSLRFMRRKLRTTSSAARGDVLSEISQLQNLSIHCPKDQSRQITMFQLAEREGSGICDTLS
jgi:hypothetical protein